MNKNKRENILKKLSDQNLINKSDRDILRKPFKELLKEEILQKKEELTNSYIEKILLENKIKGS